MDNNNKFKTIGVIGAGVMGKGVALNLAFYGYRVILKDREAHQLVSAEASIRKDIRGIQMIKKDLRHLSAEEVMGNIRFTESYEGFEEAELIIENIPEVWEQKKSLYEELNSVCYVDAYYAVNTSCISITRISKLMAKPDRVIGMHFMNPVSLKNTVETIRGHFTSDETIQMAKDFLKSIGKKAIVVQDFPGFVTNRLSHLFMNEAAFLVQDQVAAPKEIDALFKHGYGHQMGPLETADLIGLDTVVNSLKILYDSYEDPKFRCCPLLKKMVDMGHLGKKTGQGFYNYNL